MHTLLKIIGYTIIDQLRQKSFVVLLGISVLLVMLIRSCYNGNYMVNGAQVDSLNIAWHTSLIAFQVIAVGMYLMISMMAMKIFTRDLDDGSTILFLSKPIDRWQYVAGRIVGTWLLSFAFMFVLHLTIFCITWSKTGGIIPGYLTGSLICAANLLFVIVCVCLLSLYLPDFISALTTMGALFFGLILDGWQVLSASMPGIGVAQHPPFWKIVYPKVFMVQAWANAVISGEQFNNIGPINPLVNVTLWALLIFALLIVTFNKKEI